MLLSAPLKQSIVLDECWRVSAQLHRNFQCVKTWSRAHIFALNSPTDWNTLIVLVLIPNCIKTMIKYLNSNMKMSALQKIHN